MENATLRGLRQMVDMRGLTDEQKIVNRIESELNKRQYDYDQLEDILIAILATLMKGEKIHAVRLSVMLNEDSEGLTKLLDSMEIRR
jgi:transcriptional regulator NrdR family protein